MHRLDIAMGLLNFGAERFETFEMEIDRPRTDRATARRRYPRPAKTRHQGSQDEERCAHGFHQIVGRLEIADAVGVQGQMIRAIEPITLLDFLAQPRKQFKRRADVREMGHRLIGARLIGEQGRDQYR